MGILLLLATGALLAPGILGQTKEAPYQVVHG